MSTELNTYNFADIWEAVADQVPDRPAVRCGDDRRNYAELDERASRLANWLIRQGVEPGQHIGLYLISGVEYFEAMLAAFKVRAVPININYRYVESELVQLFDDADLVGVLFNRSLGARAGAIVDSLPRVRFWMAVEDGEDGETAGSVDHEISYEQALADSSPERPDIVRSSDDKYVIYTGGTTGMPKGVVWRSDDAFFACLGGGDPMRLAGPVDEPSELLDRIIDGTFVFLPVAPLMHAAGQWVCLSWLFCGGSVILQRGSLDPVNIWRTIEREHVNLITVVGDAVVRPLVDAWDAEGPFDASSLFSVGSGGAPLTPTLRKRLMEILPDSAIIDAFGSSETGAQGSQRLEAGTKPTGGVTAFSPYGDTTTVLAEGSLEPVSPGSGEIGRVALRGHIPVEYYGDPEKSAATFVEAGGHRWVLTGDLATVADDGAITLLGRGSSCINSGGEKVFAEEVEAVLKGDPTVYDAVVVGVDDERWGQRVAAVLEAEPGQTVVPDAVLDRCRGLLAGYKVPKQITVVDEIKRSPAGKADHRWARAVAEAQDRPGVPDQGQ